MKLYVDIYILFSIFWCIDSLSPNEICIMKENCSNMFQLKLKKDCEKSIKCSGKYAYQCGKDICTKSKEKCDYFVGWTTLLSKLMNGNLYEAKLKNFHKFINEIRICPTEEWSPKHVCTKKKKCYEKVKWYSRFMFKGVDFLKVAECECNGNFSINCDTLGYCGRSKKACDGVKKRKLDILEPKINILGIKSC